jgi:hypothetical protein
MLSAASNRLNEGIHMSSGLWPVFVAIVLARESWQIKRLSHDARNLLVEVDQKPIQTDRRLSKPASEFEIVGHWPGQDRLY